MFDGCRGGKLFFRLRLSFFFHVLSLLSSLLREFLLSIWHRVLVRFYRWFRLCRLRVWLRHGCRVWLWLRHIRLGRCLPCRQVRGGVRYGSGCRGLGGRCMNVPLGTTCGTFECLPFGKQRFRNLIANTT
ncbi:hypothetical protein AA0482_1695 [Acetobacter cibinongensis NRIC 0482]|nr:hypothetical protein AA0482_1695 [Acetobacter cibinongensis NRIC 0482]